MLRQWCSAIAPSSLVNLMYLACHSILMSSLFYVNVFSVDIPVKQIMLRIEWNWSSIS